MGVLVNLSSQGGITMALLEYSRSSIVSQHSSMKVIIIEGSSIWFSVKVFSVELEVLSQATC